MKKTLTFILVLSVASCLFSCRFGAWGSWKNDKIDPDLREEMATLNKKLIKAMAENNTAGVKQLASPALIQKSEAGLDSVVAQYHTAVKNDNYEIIDEYYTKNVAANNKNTLVTSDKAENNYTVDYLALNAEMYVSVLKVKLPTFSALVLAVYGRYDNGWKLNILNLGNYEVLGKTAPEYYSEAFTHYQQKDIIDAIDMISIASEIAQPGGKFFKYKEEDVMKNFYNKILKEANNQYKLPLAVKQLKTAPQLFSVSPQFINDPAKAGVFPLIKYKSNIKLTDTVALNAENQELQKVIGSVFKGIDKNNKHIFYFAFNEIPTGSALAKRYGFVQDIK
ncbi:hypothetical protein [Mucilaginibacter kameinonensis]|uniref:hypothetical protein n=1 Tax=Mucilaginibacter kameinonensis TaxID=452286 RepID=UPI000EF7F255|nr:hypothetical protein [Mucilaginibacter kameinonensis]